MTDSVYTPEMTRADRGVAIYEVLTVFYNEAIKGKSTAEVLQLQRARDEAILNLNEATGARFTLPTVLNSLTTDERAVLLGQAVRRAQQFLTTQLRTSDYTVVLGKPGAKKRNMVDYLSYSHMADITLKDGRAYVFAINDAGQHVLSESMYWENIS